MRSPVSPASRPTPRRCWRSSAGTGPPALGRRHWAIENQLHWRRDVTLREDASRVRSGAAPQALAALCNTALRLTHPLKGPLTAIRETFAENRLDAITLAQRGVL